MSKRKAIGKRLRFDIFKRDAFQCQYCGRHPPAVVLEVDHIVPVVDGGLNDADNLATACFDCNRGKAAKSLNLVPQSLSDKAAEVAEREEQLAGYNEILMARRARIEADVWRAFEALTGEQKTSHANFRSMQMFIERLGLPEVFDAVDAAKAGRRYGNAEWKYFCGVCWNKIKQAEL